MELYQYQKDLVIGREERVYVNWARGAGLTTALKELILNRRVELKSVAFDERLFVEMKNVIDELKKDASQDPNFKIVHSGKSGDYSLIVNPSSPRPKIISIQHHLLMNNKPDLLIESYYKNKTPIDGVRKLISIDRGNTFEKKIPNHYDRKIIVDYKTAFENKCYTIDYIIEQARENLNFYKEFAIKDNPNRVLAFDNFRELAIQKLQYQFLKTTDTKDTVLTRKNIIEMIKDLKSIS